MFQMMFEGKSKSFGYCCPLGRPSPHEVMLLEWNDVQVDPIGYAWQFQC